MPNSNAFTYEIDPVGSGQNEGTSVHQSSPTWVLTFVRWSNRDAIRTAGVKVKDVRDPLVVENDCISVSVSVNKGSLTPAMNAVLVMTDVNYETSVAPGDFVFVNMLNWESDARKVANNARDKMPINGPLDGFKGLFKVQGVRRVLVTDPDSGTKYLLFKINGFAFTEFNNSIYFNPYLLDPNQDSKNQLLFASYIGENWKLLINKKGIVNVQDIIAVLIQSFIGSGISDQGRFTKDGALKSPNVHFFIPSLIGSLLGVKGAKAAKDVYNFIFGIQQYAGGTLDGALDNLSVGMNPNNKLSISKKHQGRFYYTDTPCEGNSLLKPEYWNQVKTWSILNQYTNSPLNELFTCFRISPNNSVMPTMVFRQIPFTNQDFKTNADVTRFLNIPRWKINPSMIIEQDIGRDESARVNFVQFFGRSTLGVEGIDIAFETAQKNYIYDIEDVQRSGLRPYVVTTQFDDPTSERKEYRSPVWAQILGDALVGGHLKMNGSMQLAGIVAPIAVGDNLEFDGTVFHIEQITHTCNINLQSGKKTFRTSLSLSHGVSDSSSVNGTRYPEMDNPRAKETRDDDFINNQILPGVSEAQDVVYRQANVDNDDPGKSGDNVAFPQPNTIKGSLKNRPSKK